MKFPSIASVAAALRDVNASCTDGECDVRLQVYPDGAWALRVGSSDYDQDHRGYWGSSSLDGRRFDSRATARDLIDQCKEMKAQGDPT